MTLKIAAVVTGCASLFALFWFNAVSALPFLYTSSWHSRVEKSMDKTDIVAERVLALEANHLATMRTLERVEKAAERQADETAAVRLLLFQRFGK